MGTVSSIISLTQDFYFCSCWKCGVVYGVTNDLDQRRRKDGLPTYCPNGHAGYYTDTEEKRLKKRLEEEKRLRIETENDLYLEKEYTKSLKNQKRAMKGVATKMKKRIAAGVCPCCQRTFKQLASHMAKKHPKYTETN